MANSQTADQPVDVAEVVKEVIPTSVDQASQLWAQVQDVVTVWGLKVIAALAIFIIGRWVAKLVRGGIKRMMEKATVESSIIGFVSNIAYIALLAFVVVGTRPARYPDDLVHRHLGCRRSGYWSGFTGLTRELRCRLPDDHLPAVQGR